MARALLGHGGTQTHTQREKALALEVARLRRRVAELESELTEQRTRHTETLDLELHQMAETPEPALA